MNHSDDQTLLHLNLFHFADVYLPRTVSFFTSINVRLFTQHLSIVEHDNRRHSFSHKSWIYFASHKPFIPDEKYASVGNEESTSRCLHNLVSWLRRLPHDAFHPHSVLLPRTRRSLNSSTSVPLLYNRSYCGSPGKLDVRFVHTS